MASDKEQPELDDIANVEMTEGEELIDILAIDEEEELTEVEELQNEVSELKDRLMRALAEAENQRKRGERDRRDAEIYGGRKLARDLLSVYDNLKRATDAATDEQRAANAGLFSGIDLTQKEMISVFAKHQITAIAPLPGDKFDPEVHQAMFEAPHPEFKAGQIIQVMDQGFMIADRLLRPANVGVSAG